MKIEFDPIKSEHNRQTRGLPFDRAIDFDWAGAVFAEDDRNLYTERRFVGVGYLDNRLHVICFTHISGGVRIISFRKANSREAKRYGKAIALD